MSFSSEVKEELMGIVPSARHCQIAETAAFAETGFTEDPGSSALVRTDSEPLSSLVFTLVQRAYNIELVVSRDGRRARGRGEMMSLHLPSGADAEAIRKSLAHPSVLRMDCCKKAFLRGAFLAAGSISAPEKSYHLEIVCGREETAETVRDAMRSLGLDGKIVLRKGDHVVYLKEGDQIVELLGDMGASHSFLNLETVRVMKEMRGNVNRRVNCETANLNKTIVSAVRQIEDIRYIRDNGGFGDLPPTLREMAEVRLEYPDVSLVELGKYLSPPIGKSGVNHRLRKLSKIAEEKREVRC